MTLARPLPADMVVDASAILAIILGEAAASLVEGALVDAVGAIMSAATVTELLLVVDGRRGAEGVIEARLLLDRAEITVVPLLPSLGDAAYRAWQRFGKGNHRARLNFGDCFAYATAEHWGLPLLCVGDDFRRTDIELVPL